MAVTINVVTRLDDYALKRAQAEMLGLGKAAIRSDASMAGAFLRTGATLSALSGKLKAVGTNMSLYVTLPLAAVGYESVKSAMKFQSSMALIKTQAGGTAADVKVLSAAILAMKNVQYGPNELAAAMYHLKSVGMDNAQAMNGLRIATEGAAVGQADLEQTTSVLAAAWKSGVKGAGTFRDAMAETNAIVGAGNMRMGDLVSALSTGHPRLGQDLRRIDAERGRGDRRAGRPRHAGDARRHRPAHGHLDDGLAFEGRGDDAQLAGHLDARAGYRHAPPGWSSCRVD